MARTKVKLKSSLRTNKKLLYPGEVIEVDAQTALRYVRVGIAEPLPEQVEASLVAASAQKTAPVEPAPDEGEQPKASATNKGKAVAKK